MTDHLEKVVSHWGGTRPDIENLFYGFPHLRPYLYESVRGFPPTSDLGPDWVEQWILEEFLDGRTPVSACLSLCSGFGPVERILAQRGAFEYCLGVDIAFPALKNASNAANREGLSNIAYVCLDVDRISLAPRSVDLVWANGALHHLTQLESVISQAYEALRPGGLLVANEYVGPPHQQVPDRQREIINAVIHLIPDELRGHSEQTFVPTSFRRPRWKRALYQLTGQKIVIDAAWQTWKVRVARINNAYSEWVWRRRGRAFRFQKLWDVDPWYFEHIDPSEGVRSDEIIPIIDDIFDSTVVRYYNGSILLHALTPHFYLNFDPDRDDHQALLRTVIEVEKVAVQTGEVGTDHAVVVASKHM